MADESFPSEVYSRLLLAKRHGYPLYVPEPDDNLPPEYRSKGTSIGDVGIITPDGSFDFVFNICVPPDDPVNCYGVPDGSETVPLDPEDISLLSQMHPPSSDVSSDSVRKTTITVEGAQKENEYISTLVEVNLPYNLCSPDFFIYLRVSALAIVLPPPLVKRQSWLFPKELVAKTFATLLNFVATPSRTHCVGINLLTAI